MMTSSPISFSINAPRHMAFRRVILLFAILLGIQCVWVVLPPLLGAGPNRLPTDQASAAIAVQHRRSAAFAASIGIIRGSLWAESAFTYADLLWSDIGVKADPTPITERARVNLDLLLQRAHTSLDHALSDAPHQSGAWLLLAALESRHPSWKSNAIEALKMSYYTGPSDLDLMPLRLRIAAHFTILTDVEVREFITRDLRLFLARNEKSAIADAYNAASPQAKQLIEQTVGDIDPSALRLLRAGAY